MVYGCGGCGIAEYVHVDWCIISFVIKAQNDWRDVRNILCNQNSDQSIYLLYKVQI